MYKKYQNFKRPDGITAYIRGFHRFHISRILNCKNSDTEKEWDSLLWLGLFIHYF